MIISHILSLDYQNIARKYYDIVIDGEKNHETS